VGAAVRAKVTPSGCENGFDCRASGSSFAVRSNEASEISLAMAVSYWARRASGKTLLFTRSGSGLSLFTGSRFENLLLTSGLAVLRIKIFFQIGGVDFDGPAQLNARDFSATYLSVDPALAHS
jgi:small ligand-binding sensory domain FIST